MRAIVTLDPPSAPFLRDYPMPIYPVGLDHPLLARLPRARFGYSPKLVPWLRSHAHEYDRIIVNGLWNFASVGSSLALPKLDVPYFVYPHGMMDPWFREQYPLKHLLKQAFWLAFEGRLLSNAEAVLFTTEEEQRLAERQFWGHGYRGIVAGYGTQPPPADTPAQRAAFMALLPSLNDKPFLLFMSRIHPKKGCDLLVEAFARCAAEYPDVELVIAGPDSGGTKAALQEQANNRGVGNRIHWPGMLTGDAKWGAFRSAKAFVLPSHQENFGIVVAEALGCGTPVVITNKVNIWREIESEGAGFVTRDDTLGVEAGLRQMLRSSSNDIKRMSISAAETFRIHFDLSTNIERMLNIITTAHA